MIKVENLSKKYDRAIAVNDISFEIKKGEIVGFLGPNGAGKTTTLRMLTGYLKPTSGYVEMFGMNIDLNPLAFRTHIGYLPELNPLYEEMEVLEYLEYFGHLRKITKDILRKRIKTVVDSCGLGDVVGRDVGQLSKGFKQRLGLALAILHDPDILLLDEPTSGLDPNQIREIRSLIQELRKEKTVVLSTHILQEVQASCSRVLIINRGKIAASGTTDELRDMVMGKEMIRLQLKGVNQDVSASLKEIEGVGSARQIGHEEGIGTEYEIESNVEYDIREKIFTRAVEQKWIILEMHRQAANLEEIFRRLTQDGS
ncbi:MAG: ATP-binding cassette domain-containing protein [bacterium]